MKHSQKDKDLALQMFVSEGKTILQIEKETGIHQATLYRWKKKDKWADFIKDGGQLGLALELQKTFVNLIREAIEENKLTDPGMADKLSKLAKVIENIMPKAMMLSNLFTLFEILAEFVNNYTSEEFNKKFMQYMPEMSDYLRKKLAI